MSESSLRRKESHVTTPPFAHLHCHSHYSLLDGASPIDSLVNRAKELGMNALAITDHGNLYGALEFYQACRGAGINPIVGYEAYVAPGSRFDKSASPQGRIELPPHAARAESHRFSESGEAREKAFLEGFYHKPRIDRELLAAHQRRDRVLERLRVGRAEPRASLGQYGRRSVLAGREACGVVSSSFRRSLLHRDSEQRRRDSAAGGGVIDRPREAHGIAARGDERRALCAAARMLSRRMCCLCINTGKFRTDTNRMRMEGDQFYLRSPEEMYASFPGHEDAVARSQQIADSVDMQLELGKRHFPAFTPPAGKTTAAHLRELCEAGLRERYADDPQRWQNDDPQSGELSDEVRHRDRARAGRDREARLLRLLPHRVGLRAVRGRAEDSLHRSWFGRGFAGVLRAQDQPRLPAAVRPAVRAVLGRKPPRGA